MRRLLWWGAIATLAGGCAEQASPIEALDAGPECAPRCAAGARRCGPAGTLQLCAGFGGDGCFEWGGDVDCPAGARCAAGQCVATCTQACAVGEAICGSDGPRTCADADGDGCRALGPPTPCDPTERCDDGACVPRDRACADGCPAEGARDCADDGYRRCGDFDEDACLEWSVTIPCDAGSTCARAGECVPDCSDDCAVGEVRCDGDGFAGCGNHDRDVCLEFGPPIPCAGDERCDDGRCVPRAQPCTDACDLDGLGVCADDATGFRACGQFDADPCLELSDLAPCGATRACEAGACVRVCEDTCAPGGRRCRPEGLQACGNFDGDACLEWGGAVACPAGQQCDDGACVVVGAPCEDACGEGTARCGPDGVERCADVDDDPCLEWGPATPCGADERCVEDGRCEVACTDACQAGATTCIAGGVAACGQADADDCLELEAPVACPDDQSCSDGACRADCVDDCAADQVACTPDGGGVRRCGDFDADDCRDWSSPTPCGAREICEAGACVAVCADACAAGSRGCLADGYEVCGDFDDDPCLEFGGGARCEMGEACRDGNCQSACLDDCAAGARRCVDARSQERCGNFDGDACLEWGATEDCAAFEACGAEGCGPTPPPGAVRINEVRVNPPGDDHLGAFVELWGPGGLPFDGFRLVGINGATGQEYGVATLSGNIPADGYFVLAHPEAAEPLASRADRLDPAADLQNGPDSVQLRWGDAVVDALGYGIFGADDLFAGEGTAAPRVEESESLGRDADHTDTDDNAADFTAQAPSPGAGAPCADVCAAAETRCADDAVEVCRVAPAGCLDWLPAEDCGGAGGRCEAGACIAPVGCEVPTTVGPFVGIPGLRAQHVAIDVVPVEAGFGVAAGAPVQGVSFALVDLDGALVAGPHVLGNTDFAPWGNSASDVYYPSLVADDVQFAVTWSGFSDQGNRDIYFRRLGRDGSPVARLSPVISGGSKGFSPILRRLPEGFRVIFNEYTHLARIDLDALGTQGAVIALGDNHEDTREDSFMARADLGDGTSLWAYVMGEAGGDALFLQRVDAQGAAQGPRRRVAEANTSAGNRAVWIFPLPLDRFGVFWRATLADANRTQGLRYAVIAVDGTVLSEAVVNDLARPELYRPEIVPESIHFDGVRFGVVHRREATGQEARHWMIQWMTPEGVHVARTELGAEGRALLTRHADDGRYRLFRIGDPVAVAILGCE